MLAGGDGSRLGCKGPKGLYNLGLKSSETFFELFFKRVKHLSELALKKFPNKNLKRDPIIIYLVLKKAHCKEIYDYLKKVNYFNYPTIAFCETTSKINLFDNSGKILFNPEKKLLKSSLGNGDFINLLNKGLISDLEKNGIKYINISGIDNILFKPVDPFFIGFTSKKNLDMSFKTMEKTEPEENVGIHGINDKGYTCYEYIHMDMDTRKILDKNGKLLYRYLHSLNMVVSIEGLKMMAAEAKNISEINFVKRSYNVFNWEDESSKLEECNKFEFFFLDYYLFVKKQGYLAVERGLEFAPIKRKEGRDTPQTALTNFSDMNKRILGIKDCDDFIDIDPKLFYCNDLEERYKNKELEDYVFKFKID